MAMKTNAADSTPEVSEMATTHRLFRRDRPPAVGCGISEFATLPAGTDPETRCEAHNVPEVHYVLSGTGVLYEDGERIALTPGDAVITLPGARHTLWADGPNPLVTFYTAIGEM